MHTKHIFSTVLLSLASASVILAIPTTNKRSAESDIICPLDCLDGDCAGCPPLPPREEPNEKLSSRNVDAVPGCPFNCNEDGCDLCAPPSPSEVKKEKREEELVKRNEFDPAPVRMVERKEDLICIPGQWPPVRVCTGEGCIHCPPEVATRQVKRAEDLICIPGQWPPVRVCTGEGCIHCPPEDEPEKEKREEDRLCDSPPAPDCKGLDCLHCPSEAETEKEKRAARKCVPSCIGEHCHCDDEGEEEVERVEGRGSNGGDSWCIGPDCGPSEEETRKLKRAEKL